MSDTKNKSAKKVLIVDDEKLFLESLSEGLAVLADEFSVVTATDGQNALDKLAEEEADLVVTDLKMPVLDGFDLLARMIIAYPHIPVIVMTAFGTPDIEKHLENLDAYDYLEKPIDFQILADKIRAGINRSSDGNIKGIMLASFLQLLQMEQKTCMLKINAHGRKGTLYFSGGELFDAVYEHLEGEPAAYEIVGWEDAEIEIVTLTKKIRRRIRQSLSSILIKSAQRRDEAATNDFELDFGEPTPMPTEPEILSSTAAIAQNFDRQPNALKEKKPTPAVHPEKTNKQQKIGNNSSDSLNKQEKQEQIIKMANNINESLEELLSIEGAVAVALVDSSSGMALGTAGGGFNLEVAAAGNSEVIKAKGKVMKNLDLKDRIEDILITLGQQYHLLRPLANHQNLFFYLVLTRANSNLAMARFKLTEIESRVEV